MRFLLVLIFSLVSVNAVYAENWLNISKEDEEPYYFDRDSVLSRYDPNGNLIVSMWTMYPSKSPVVKTAVASQMLNQANCNDMSIKHAELLELDKDSEIVWRLSQVKNIIGVSPAVPLDYYYPKSDSEYLTNLQVLCHEETIKLGFENAEL